MLLRPFINPCQTETGYILLTEGWNLLQMVKILMKCRIREHFNKNSEYDQEISQSQTADKPVASALFVKTKEIFRE